MEFTFLEDQIDVYVFFCCVRLGFDIDSEEGRPARGRVEECQIGVGGYRYSSAR